VADRYVRPGWFTRRIFNPAVAALTEAGISVVGSRVLAVQGRKSGEWHSTPVNVLPLGGQRYLVSPRGVTQWVKNVRISKQAKLRVGRRTETVSLTEIADGAKTEILRAYLRRWRFEVGVFFDGVTAKSPDEDLLRIAPGHPIFLIEEQSQP
jgi:hypothetical protein